MVTLKLKARLENLAPKKGITNAYEKTTESLGNL